MKFVRDNGTILFRTFYFPLPQHKSKYTTWKLEILTPVCTHAIVLCSLPKEHLPLTPEARLRSRAPGSEMTTLQVSPVAGLSAQVFMCPICVGACAAGGQALILWGSCSYGNRSDREGGILTPSVRRWCLMGPE